MTLVVGVDSGTQSVKAIVFDVDRNTIVGEGRVTHTGDTTQDPAMWWDALVAAVRSAIAQSGCGDDVRAISVGAQQHGLVTLDADGAVVRPAPLWNNTDAASDAHRLNAATNFAAEIGSRLVASFTVAKLAHFARTAPADLDRTDAICLPHDYLTYRLTGHLVTDRGEASGSGWWSPLGNEDRRDLLKLAVGDDASQRLRLPRVLGPNDPAGELTGEAAHALGLRSNILVGAGTGDNAAAALGIGAAPGELVISLGTSGTAFMVSTQPSSDPSGEVAGFADATGHFLPLTCMLNCTRVVETVARLIGLSRDAALAIADSERPGAGGLVLLPYFSGERTPNLPDATGEMVGITDDTMTPAHLLRAALDGVAAGLAYCVEALERQGLRAPRITLVGGGASSPAWQQAIADATGLPITVRGGGEHAARGMALQAAAVVSGLSVANVIAAMRPPVIAEVDPRSDMRDAFALDQRREMIARLQAPS